MYWVICGIILVLVWFFFANSTIFWIMLSVIGFGLLVWFAVSRVVKYFRNKKREANRLIMRKRNQEAVQKGQEERELITSEIDKHLHRALGIMDSTAKWYNDEDEANKELVSILKAQNIEAIYLYRLSNGRTADAKVGNVLIEGKLSPDTAEIDRLIGQLSHYTQYSDGNKVNVVIYGEFSEEAKTRIEKELHLRYEGRVFLSYLDNPQRLRRV